MAKLLLAALAMLAAGVSVARAETPAAETEAHHIQTGAATFYGQKFEGRRTASGDVFRHAALTAAHSTFPFGTVALVTCLTTGNSVTVRITDRLPSKRAIIDLTRTAAAELRMIEAGRVRVTVKVLEWGKGGLRSKSQRAAPEPASPAEAVSAAVQLVTHEAERVIPAAALH